jgi:hypothetical protein
MPRYDFQPPGIGNLEAVLRYLEQELSRIRGAIDALYDGEHETTPTEPSKPRFGDVAVAEPGGWNPGSGPGIYSYEGTTTASASWTKL